MTEVQEPWGRDESPVVVDATLAPLPAALADIEAMLESGDERPVDPGERHQLPGPDDLPEVSAMADDGWEPLPSGFMGREYALLPQSGRASIVAGCVDPVRPSTG